MRATENQIANTSKDNTREIANPFRFEDFASDAFKTLDRCSKRFGFPSSSSFFSDPFFDQENEDLSFEDRFSRMVKPFFSEMNEFGCSSSLFKQDNELSRYTEKLFEEFSKNGTETEEQRNMCIEEEEAQNELLNHPKELEDLYKTFKPTGSEDNSVVTGRSFVSSTITRNGKSVTVSKQSELTPDGTIKTRIDQKLRDRDGHDQTKSWKKDFLMNGNQQNMLKNNDSQDA